MDLTLTPNLLIVIVAALIAILFDWLPGLKTWYDKILDGQKRGLMALLLLIITAAIFLISCAGWLNIATACNLEGAKSMVYMFLAAVAVNQGVHILTKPT
jgi:hypothetical protein